MQSFLEFYDEKHYHAIKGLFQARKPPDKLTPAGGPAFKMAPLVSAQTARPADSNNVIVVSDVRRWILPTSIWVSQKRMRWGLECQPAIDLVISQMPE